MLKCQNIKKKKQTRKGKCSPNVRSGKSHGTGKVMLVILFTVFKCERIFEAVWLNLQIQIQMAFLILR